MSYTHTKGETMTFKQLIKKLIEKPRNKKAWHGSYLINHFLKN